MFVNMPKLSIRDCLFNTDDIIILDKEEVERFKKTATGTQRHYIEKIGFAVFYFNADKGQMFVDFEFFKKEGLK